MSEMAVESQIINAFGTYIVKSINGIMKSLEGLDAQQLNWKPPAPNSNSLYAIATHTVTNSQENLLILLCAVPTEELPLKVITREQAFMAQGDSIDSLFDEWKLLQPELVRRLNALPGDALTGEFQHPRRGKLTGLDILLSVTNHMAEHLGHAELTRDLVKAL